jgi:adenylate kinase family enzyme
VQRSIYLCKKESQRSYIPADLCWVNGHYISDQLRRQYRTTWQSRRRTKFNGGDSYSGLVTGSLVILTGASGSGKTTLARAVQTALPTCEVTFFDSIGIPSAETMATYAGDYGQGGGWQRTMTMEWMQRIAALLKFGKAVLFEGQMRIAFIEEAIAAAGITNARIVLIDCSDSVRIARLADDRQQPDLANENMISWARFLREEAKRGGYEILDTGSISFSSTVDILIPYLRWGRSPPPIPSS